ncbi:hypothetical protein [Acinetobacter sp.]|uniref:hypothetical protein n=1 Tax=Acinetobacter sp. TaxID=472 RepID=UPI0035AED6CD
MVDRSVTALIQAADGTALKGAKVTVAGQSAVTDEYGAASFKVRLPQFAKNVVVSFTKDGFITQSMVYDAAGLERVAANLLAVKQTIAVSKIEEAQVIQSAFLGASISIPAGAFVLPNGQPAAGAAKVQFTPWDIAGSDLNAMPANGAAVDAQGNPASLISAGMITAIFTDAAGNQLQLAQGKTADIQMHLPLSSINNQAMAVGTSIPMWHFNEAKGLWEEQGAGKVVKDSSSATGFAVHAQVSHFSTWNWDFKFDNSGSVTVQCKAAAQPMPCHITAKVELEDGSGLTKVNSISAEGTKIVNMPSKGTIYWSAKDSTGTLIGSEVSGTSGTVTIDLGAPKTNNFVQCELEDGTAVACSGSFAAQVQGDEKTAEFTADNGGARVLTGLQADNNQLSWSAHTSVILINDQWFRYTGTAVSSSKSAVKIILKDKEVIASDKGLKFRVQCSSYDYNTGNESADPFLKGKPCEVQVEVYFSQNGNSLSEKFIFDSVYGQERQVRLPNLYSGFKWLHEGNISYIYIQGRMLNKKYCSNGYGDEGFKNDKNPLIKLNMYFADSPPDTLEFCKILS